MGVYPLCIYTWHRCAPSSGGGTLCAIIYIPAWRRLYCFLSLTPGFTRTSIGKGNVSDRFPTPSFYDSNPVSNNLLYLGSRWSTEKGRKVHRYGEENGFGCFAPTDIRTSDR